MAKLKTWLPIFYRALFSFEYFKDLSPEELHKSEHEDFVNHIKRNELI